MPTKDELLGLCEIYKGTELAEQMGMDADKFHGRYDFWTSDEDKVVDLVQAKYESDYGKGYAMAVQG